MGRYRYARKSLQVSVGVCGVLAVGMFIAAAVAIFEQPRAYRALADHGVRTTATARCDRDSCELTYTFAGREHTNRYGKDLRQFCRCPDPTPVLVDPSDPATMYTVRDVRRGTNAGVGVFSLTMIAIGLFFVGMMALSLSDLRNPPTRLPQQPPPAFDRYPQARAVYATVRVRELLEVAVPLLGYTWHRVDRDELAARVEELRRSIATIWPPRPEALDAADRIAREVSAAPRIPVLGGARVRAGDLAEQLDEIRRGLTSGSPRDAPQRLTS